MASVEAQSSATESVIAAHVHQFAASWAKLLSASDSRIPSRKRFSSMKQREKNQRMAGLCLTKCRNVGRITRNI